MTRDNGSSDLVQVASSLAEACLAERGVLDESLLLVTSDHGEMLGEHDEVTHGFFIYEAAVRIPLIIAGPGVPTTTIDRQVRIVDVLPTLLARFGLTPPAATQGVDLMPLARGEKIVRSVPRSR